MIEFFYLFITVLLGSTIFSFAVFLVFLNLGLLPSPPGGHWTQKLHINPHAQGKKLQSPSEEESRPQHISEAGPDIKLVDLNVEVARVSKILREFTGGTMTVMAFTESGLTRMKLDPTQLSEVLLNLAINLLLAGQRHRQLTVEARELKPDAELFRWYPNAQPGPHVVLGVSSMTATHETESRTARPPITAMEHIGVTGAELKSLDSIVRQHGGYLVTETKSGRDFEIYLPLAGARR
jgi:hypothetical protein